MNVGWLRLAPGDVTLWQMIRRDGITRDSGDERRQLELCRIMWWMRHLALTGALVLGGGDREFGRTDLLVAVFAVWQLVAHVLVTRSPEVSERVTVADALIFLVASALGLPPFLVLVVSVAMLGWAATFRPVPAVGSYLVVLTAVGLDMGLWPGRLGVGSAVLAFCLLGGILMMRLIRLNIGARRAAERERLVSERIDAVLWEEIPGDGGLKVSPAAERLLGYPASAWAEPEFWRELVHPDDRDLCDFGRVAAAGGSTAVRLRHANGTWRWVENRTASFGDRQGRHAFFVGVLIDRTPQMEAEREALAFGHLVSLSPIGQMLLRCDGESLVIEAMNQACHRLLALGPEAIGSVLEPEPVAGFAIQDVLTATDPSAGQVTEFEGADGRTYHAVGRRIDAHSCKIDFMDVTERVEAGRLLHAQARQDELTGLPNRRAFLEALEERLASGSGEPTGLLLLDLDDFKEINDSLGHHTGDDVLRSVGQRISSTVADTDLVARLGGDEFAVILPGTHSREAAARGQQLAEVIGQPVVVGDLRLRVRASVGIAVHPTDAADATELIRRADIAMYQAKNHGAEATRYDPATDQFRRERVTLMGDLDLAVTADQLVLHHQPLIDVATGAVVGTEALVRWLHPVLGMIPPQRFIELAEVSGQIKPLTRWVIHRALTDLMELGEGWQHLEVSVNLSVRNLYEPDLLDWVEETLRRLDLDGRRLVVEITEGTVMGDHAAAVDMIEGLRALGLRTWIDDFGTGYSSLARLRSLPVDGVKIDRSFVTSALTSTGDQHVLRSLVELVNSLGLSTIAEGVERPECLDLLRTFGCDLAQGHHIARPMPAHLLRRFLSGVPASPPAPRRSKDSLASQSLLTRSVKGSG